MSYRDKVTISFEGASLWILAGGNGAGKSTVFDAMRWTLFGAHRGGRSGNEALIHRDRERLRVSFDVGLGDERFRLIRTLSRTSRATWQIEKSNGADLEKIPETDGRDGYENWLREHIGLSDETFCAAMYLAQGRGDAILSANPVQRYEMLREIVDISAFAALHERAKTRAFELENAAKLSERVWQFAPDAPAEEIEICGEKLRELSAQLARKSARREEILRLEPLATQWENLQIQRAERQKSLDAMRFNLQDAPQIERDFARLSELETLLPLLETYEKTRERLSQNGREAQRLRARLQLENAKCARLELEFQSAQTWCNELENAQKERENARLDALSKLGELAPQLADARQIALYEQEIAELETEIATFPADLEVRIGALEAQVEQAQNQEIAAEVLRRFAREKSRFLSARESQREAQTEIARLEIALPDAKEQLKTASRSLEMAREEQTRAVQELSATTTRRHDAQSAHARFDEVRGASNCYFCGQILTPEHAENEVTRLQTTLQKAKDDEARATETSGSQNFVSQSANEKLENAQNALRNLENKSVKARGDLQNAQVSLGQASVGAAEILTQLSADFAALFDEKPSRKWDEARVFSALSGEFPSPDDLKTLQHRAENLGLWRADLRVLSAQETARREIAVRARDRKNQLAPLRARLSEAALAELRELENELQVVLQEAIPGLKSGAVPAKKAREMVALLEKSRAATERETVGLESRIAALEAAQVEIARALDGAQHSRLIAFFALEDLALGAELSRLQSEKSRLESSDLRARAAALEQAQDQISLVEGEVLRLEWAIGDVPPDARKSPQLLQNETESLKIEVESGEEERSVLQLEKAELERRRATKAELEAAHLSAQNAARQHKTLADLLGPHQLQRYLLREAENGISDEANASLDRISGGTLRLELRADDDEIAGARKTAPKILDIAVFRADETPNSTGRTAGMLPAFLSGSQRFRVAVSLALGIGRYAMRGGSSRLEAVIIDEGFGSLDKIGRGEMIDELKSLGQELKRVILVSHQEEFADAFPNRYLIENDGATSTAKLMVG